MIDINGADNVTIDGLNVSGNALTIQNTTVSSTSGTSTIRFQADATNNLVTNCSLQGSATMASGTNGGVVWFGSAAVTTGNDNNTVSNCDIGPAGTNLPSTGIYFTGTTTTSTLNNSGIVLNNNTIHDYFNPTLANAGVYISSGSTGITVSNNKFFQAATRTQTTGTQISAVWITNSSGDNFQVTGNTIGYAAANGTGTMTYVMASATKIVPIFFSVNTTVASVANNNIITNIGLSGAGTSTSTTSPFRGIYISTGLVNANGNTIGSTTTNGAISYTTSSASATDIIGIFSFGSSALIVNNNNIGGITAANSSTGACNIYGIRYNTGSGVTTTVQGNTIGGTVANSIQSTAVGSTANIVYGILATTSNSTIVGNSIGSLSVASGAGTGTAPAVAGIVFGSTSVNNTVTGNTITTIGCLNPASTCHVTGIMYTSSSGANLISKNNINSLVSASPTVTLNGIFINGGTATYANNMIRLGLDPTGAALTAGCPINGISETVAGTNNLYHNSIYIGGSGVGGASNTFAFQSSITTNVRNYQDNIFYNARSNGAGTGKHYAIRVGGTAANPAGLTTNYNVLFANGTGGFNGLVSIQWINRRSVHGARRRGKTITPSLLIQAS